RRHDYRSKPIVTRGHSSCNKPFALRGSLWIVLTLVACGDDAPVMVDAPIMQNPDAPTCQPQSAVGTFYRRMPNPRIVASTHAFADTKLDKDLYNPDLVPDGSTWHLYYETTHDTTAGVIRHASSSDLATWTYDDTPAIAGTKSQPSV